LPYADRHRHCFVVASTLLTLVLVCLLSGFQAQAAPSIAGKWHGLERRAEITKAVSAWAVRRQTCDAGAGSTPPRDMIVGPATYALYLHDGTNLFFGSESACLGAEKSTFLTSRPDEAGAPRAPPAAWF